ncbi:hypothetical protein EYF80_003444 [Liparis tanakae]|uniref:Uncharacterized protein n=1 Tax=Liparis tanakae TaxID=230148 RepID=A0A4Z2J859_9TELE|nr:hypothetical protein EYF80_003444 [Liparis tanakae]
MQKVVVLPLLVQVIQKGTCSDEDVIVPFEHEDGRGAVPLEPMPEQQVLQGQVVESVSEIPLQDIPVFVVLELQEVSEVRMRTCT